MEPPSLCERLPAGTEKIRPSTFETYTAEDRERNLDIDAGQRSDNRLLFLRTSAPNEIAAGALLLSHPIYGVNALPGVRIHFIFAEETCWPCLWSHRILKDYMSGWESEGRGSRVGHIAKPAGANHFVSSSRCTKAFSDSLFHKLHWDDPDRLLMLINKFNRDVEPLQVKL